MLEISKNIFAAAANVSFLDVSLAETQGSPHKRQIRSEVISTLKHTST